uniref:Uncharacterized protein n=1 Tax=Arundo donax TaxID=35708 RepID=A0A0A8YA64_ARUDO
MSPYLSQQLAYFVHDAPRFC